MNLGLLWAVTGWCAALLPLPTSRECSCRCIVESEPSSAVLEILSHQLERCGPERLGAPCPAPRPCPVLDPGYPREVLVYCCVVFFILGILVNRWWAADRREKSRAAAPLIELQNLPATVLAEKVESSESPPPSTSSIHRRLLGRARGGGRGRVVTA